MIARALLVAAALSTAVVTPAWSGGAPPPIHPAPPSPGPGAGPWVVGGVIVSALSLMICAEWECARSHREMSSEEAIWAAGIPFSCFWWRRYHSERDHGPTCSGPPKP